ncbi:MAG TPA: winged helix DNA-binding domain-containing protein [Candidatus Dormibacteraeota bacterium]|nr:winged helix DNA-binding domain-containing protein [Candidatus Dormibacteraeota bacterium]
MNSIAGARLRAHGLTGKPFGDAIEAVRRMGAVQSQDYPAAKWALAQRLDGATDAALDHLYDQGAILRTHVLRPTWHFVLPEDIRWLLALTGPRLMAGAGRRLRQLEIDGEVIARSRAAWHAALGGGRSMTRSELAGVLAAAGISPKGQRLMYLLMALELEGFLASGPRSGMQLTWALLEDLAAAAPSLEPEDALSELTRRYFRSHGPAQPQDFAWWSGLTLGHARKGIALAGADLARRSIDGKEYWHDPELDWRAAPGAAVHLLPNFDEYTVAYRDRSALLHADYPFRPELFAFSSLLSNIVTAGGELRGAWHRVTTARGVRIEVRPLAPLSRSVSAGVEEAARRYGRFLEQPVELAWMQPD